MAQQSRSSEKNFPGAKGLHIDSVLQDDLTNTNNSVGLIDPLLVERFSGNNRDTSKKPSVTTGTITKNRAATIKTKKQTTLESFFLSDKTLNKENVTLPADQWQVTKKSPANAKTTKNGEWKPYVVSNRVKKPNKKFQLEGQKKLTDFLCEQPLVLKKTPIRVTDFLLAGEQPLALKETPIKSCTPKKIEFDEAKEPTAIVSTGLDEYLVDDKTLPARQWQPASKNTVQQLVLVEIASTTTNKSSINAKTSTNEERDEIEPNEAINETTLASLPTLDLPADLTLETKNREESPSTRNLRSSCTHEERKSRSVRDFSIEDMDWYYEDENYYKNKCKKVLRDFAIPKSRPREMNAKLSYTYLLLDSRRFKNKENINWLTFIAAIFYIGKGTDKRAFQHAKDAEKWMSDDNKVIDKTRNKKYLRIKKIWDSGNPIKVFLVKEDIIKGEAFTREAAMIDAMGMKRLCNLKHGSYYGVAEMMKARQRLELGATLLMEAMEIFKLKEEFDVYPKIKLDIVKSERINVICDNDDPEDID